MIIGIVAKSSTEETVLNNFSEADSDLKDVSVVMKDVKMRDAITGEYEVDHLISLELGGANDIANLWPEAADPKPGFHEKDKVENHLHDQVCSGAILLPQAWVEISTNWMTVYDKMPQK